MYKGESSGARTISFVSLQSPRRSLIAGAVRVRSPIQAFVYTYSTRLLSSHILVIWFVRVCIYLATWHRYEYVMVYESIRVAYVSVGVFVCTSRRHCGETK